MATFPNFPGIPQLANPTIVSANYVAANPVIAAPILSSLINLLKPTWGIYFQSSITTGGGTSS